MPRLRRRPDRSETPAGGVLVVDDHHSVRDGLARLLALDPRLGPVKSAATASRAIDSAQRLRPAVAVVDYRLPGNDGISLTLELKRLEEPPAVVVYSAFAGDCLALAAIIAGAEGIVDKGAGVEELRRAVQAVARGEQAIPDLPAHRLSALVARLSGEDGEIVAMLVSGVPLEQVAHALEIDTEWLELRRWAIIRRLTFGLEGRRARISRR